MAKQDGIVKVRGSIDNLTFSRTKNGSQVGRRRASLSQEEIQTNPKFARLKENMSEFNRASAAKKLMRIATNDIASQTKDRTFSNRLTTAMMAVLLSDPHNKRGERTVVDGNITLLKNFNFNPPSTLSQAMKIVFPTNIDRATGKITADIPVFIPDDVLASAPGATHFMIHSMGLEINFGTAVFDAKIFASQGIKLGTDPTPAINIQHQLAANSTNPLFLLVGIRFYQEVNGVMYLLRSAAHNALEIVDVNAVS